MKKPEYYNYIITNNNTNIVLIGKKSCKQMTVFRLKCTKKYL